MPRTVKEIADQAEALADRFERMAPRPGDVKDASELRRVRRAFLRRARAEQELADAVHAARQRGHTWATIGMMVGTSGEAARQRYGAG